MGGQEVDALRQFFEGNIYYPGNLQQRSKGALHALTQSPSPVLVVDRTLSCQDDMPATSIQRQPEGSRLVDSLCSTPVGKQTSTKERKMSNQSAHAHGAVWPL